MLLNKWVEILSLNVLNRADFQSECTSGVCTLWGGNSDTATSILAAGAARCLGNGGDVRSFGENVMTRPVGWGCLDGSPHSCNTQFKKS